MTIKYVLARLDTDENVIGELDGELLKKCLIVDYTVDEKDCCNFNVGFAPVFDYLSDDLIDINTELIIYKTDKINPGILSQYKEVVADMLRHTKIKSTLIDINSNIKKKV
jgi:hypothetical protein